MAWLCCQWLPGLQSTTMQLTWRVRNTSVYGFSGWSSCSWSTWHDTLFWELSGKYQLSHFIRSRCLIFCTRSCLLPLSCRGTCMAVSYTSARKWKTAITRPKTLWQAYTFSWYSTLWQCFLLSHYPSSCSSLLIWFLESQPGVSKRQQEGLTFYWNSWAIFHFCAA